MKNLLKLAYPNSTAANREKYADALADAMDLYDINTPYRKAAFLANVGVESGQLVAVVENLNYTANGLKNIFSRYFPTQQKAELYARRPEAIANVVYADRLGNGNTESGDGWKYRGRGLIQLTGRANYRAATNGMRQLPMGLDFEDTPEKLAEPRWAAQSAAWYWQSNGLNEMADKLKGAGNAHDILTAIRRRINGGTLGLVQVEITYKTIINNIVR